MTIHLISVGLSLMDTLRGGPRLRNADRSLAASIAREKPWEILGTERAAASGWLTGALATESSNARDSDRAGLLAETTGRIQPHLWPGQFSAELDTFARDPAVKLPLDVADVAVLVSSDTAGGLTAALWNAVALAGGDLARVRYLADPTAPIGAARGQAVLARVPGLDAGDSRGFSEAMRGLGSLGHSLRYGVAGEGEAFRCYLSGGFKAAIPYLIGLAEGLRSLPDTGPVDAVVLHELTEFDPIRLPLRRMAPEMVAEELRGFDGDGVRRHDSGPGFLDGYAYEKHGSTWQLTPFGEGLRALFDGPPEGLGG
ncbi:MAG: hypothetical protein ACRDSP_22570 [Pseudonocardiaceae bacterium]